MVQVENVTTTKFALSTGDSIPAIGLGTWQSEGDSCAKAVEAALRAGYRYIDTAYGYENEKEVGLGLTRSGVARKEVFVTTKLDNGWHDRAEAGLDASLASLGIDYVDLFLMHWPVPTDPKDDSKLLPNWDFVKTWAEMQKLPATGKCRAIGVSNLGITNLEKLLAAPTTSIVPAVNQIELHPYCPSAKLVAFCKEKDIHLTGYCCLGSTNSKLLHDETIKEIAEANKKTAAQVLLKWGVQHGWDVIPKSANTERIQSNFDLDGWVLADADMAKLDALKHRFKVCDDSWLPEKVFFGDDE